MKNILFICPNQFGYHTGTYYTIKLIASKYKISYIGFDEGNSKKDCEGVNILHINRTGNRFKDRHVFFREVRRNLKLVDYDFIFLNYFSFCSCVKFIAKSPINVDVRTSFIFKNPIKRFIANVLLTAEVRLFDNISAISSGLVKYLSLPSKTHILPLGAPRFSIFEKSFSEINCIYIGTFYDRNIPITIKGFSKFYNEYCSKIKMHYDIIGFGSEDEVNLLTDTINECIVNDNIVFHGSVRYPELEAYLRYSNVGVSYIPMKTYYNCQPPTKTYEYLLSGMAVLATGTNENKLVIDNSNGIIIGETIDNFYDGLVEIYENMKLYDSANIQKNADKYSWEMIIAENLIPFIEKLSKRRV